MKWVVYKTVAQPHVQDGFGSLLDTPSTGREMKASQSNGKTFGREKLIY